MIHSRSIPMKATTFVRRCTDDVLQGRYAKTPDGYLEYLVDETRKRDKALLAYLCVLDRQSGKPRYSAEADHIVPRSVWTILMFGLVEPGSNGSSFNVLSNLFWRDPDCNRRYDHFAIEAIKGELAKRSLKLNSSEGVTWREKWIEIFLTTKHDEGVMFPGELMEPHKFDEFAAADEQSNWLSRD
jgi:hypothetical protein